MRSQKKRRYVMIISMNPRKLATNRVSPRISENKIMKNTSKISPRFNASNDCGKMM